MRADTVGGILFDPVIVIMSVVKANDALAAFIVVLGGEQDAPIGREGAVAIEVTAGCGIDAMKRNAFVYIDDHGEAPRPPREYDHMRPGRVERHGMPALGQRQAEVGAAHLVKSGHVVSVPTVCTAADEERPGMTTHFRRPQAAKTEQAAGRTAEQCPSIDVDHATMSESLGAYRNAGLRRSKSSLTVPRSVTVGFVEADGERGGVGEGAGEEGAQRFDFLQKLLDLLSCGVVADGIKET